jgi:carboxyl-terminal processing protease
MLKTSITLKHVRNATLILSLLVLSGGIGFLLGERKLEIRLSKLTPFVEVINRSQPIEHRSMDFSLFWQVWDELEQSYLDPTKVDKEQMIYGAISGMTASLRDPYTVFLPPDDNKQNKENLSGSFYGVGIQIGFKKFQLVVIAPLAGMPAERAGVEAGDIILNIKDDKKGVDRDTQDITLPEAVSLIRGELRTDVTLKLYREDVEEPIEVKLVREEIIIPSVELSYLPVDSEELGNSSKDKRIAHIKLTQFGERTMEEWNEIIEETLSLEGMLMGIILDMRNNPGGYLSGSVEIASEFLSDGTVVVQQGRYQSETFSVIEGGKLKGIPVVVLVNQGSASASEIVAGALRDRAAVTIVGEKTFGKGTVQEARNIPGGAGLHITTAEWILPSGKKINGEGLIPDYEVEDIDDDEEIDEQLEKAKEILLL